MSKFLQTLGMGCAACALALSCALGGCGDDDGSDSDAGGEPGPTLRCRDDVLERREGDNWVVEQDCAESSEVCSAGDAGVASCVAAPCLTGEKNCEGDVLLLCADGEWEVEQDCADSGQRCVPLLGGLPICSSERE